MEIKRNCRWCDFRSPILRVWCAVFQRSVVHHAEWIRRWSICDSNSSDSIRRVLGKTVQILNQLHFQVARESKLEGVIETEYRGGSGILEPWHKDSIGFHARLESSLQSIRRKVIVRFQESAPGTVVVGVQVLKEIEDLNGSAAGSQGAATFTEGDFFDRDLDRVVGESGSTMWLNRGNDVALQAEIVRQIRF